MSPNVVAGGNIAIAAFVTMDVTTDNQVVQATGTAAPLLGISTPSQKYAPLPANTNYYAAELGDPVTIFGLGDITILTAGSGGWTRGDKLSADTSGRGVTVTSGAYVGAIALQSCLIGDYGRVQIVSFKI